MQEERTNRPVSGGSESLMVCSLLLLIFICIIRLDQEPEDSVNKKAYIMVGPSIHHDK